MTNEFKDILTQAKRQDDLSNWRNNWSPVSSAAVKPEDAAPAAPVDAASISDAARLPAFSVSIPLVRGPDADGGSVDRVTAAAAYSAMSE